MKARTSSELKRRSGADLRAQRDQRQATPGPMLEAARRAQSIRDGLNSFADAIEKMADAYNRDDWKTLGYKSWQEYCDGEFSGERVRLTVEQRKQAAASLTSAGLTKRAAAAALGVSHTTVQKDAGSGNKLPPATVEAQVKTDAEVADEVDLATADFDEKYSQDTSGGTGGVPTGGQNSPAGKPVSGFVQPAGDTNSSDAASDDQDALVAQQSEAPAGQPSMPDASGDIESTATGRPGIEPPTAMGEAPASEHGLSAGVTPSVPGRAGEAVEGGASTPPDVPSSTDPEAFVAVLEGWIQQLDQVDADALGPLMTDNLLARAHLAADNLAWFVGLLDSWQKNNP